MVVMYLIVNDNVALLYDLRTENHSVVSVQEEMSKYDKICEEAYSLAKKETAVSNIDWLDSPWSGFFEGRDPMRLPVTGVPEETLQHIGSVFSTPPEDFVIHGGIIWAHCVHIVVMHGGRIGAHCVYTVINMEV